MKLATLGSRFVWLAIVLSGCRSTPLPAADTDTGMDASGVVTLYDRGENQPRAIEIGGDYLYWSEATSDGLFVLRAPKAGGGRIEQLGTFSGMVISGLLFAIDPSEVFWQHDQKVLRLPLDRIGSPPHEIPFAARGGSGMVADERYLFIADLNCTGVTRIDKATETMLYAPLPEPEITGNATDIAVDDSHVFCSHGSRIFMLDKSAMVPRTLVNDQLRAGSIVSDRSHVYWINNRPNLGTGEENLVRASKNDGEAESLGTIGHQIGSLRLDAPRSRLFFAGAAGGVRSYNLDEARFDDLAPPDREMRGALAQDDDHLYWTSGHTIRRLRKPAP